MRGIPTAHRGSRPIEWRSLAAENLAADASCTACSRGGGRGPTTPRRLTPRHGSSVPTGIGGRLSPAAIRSRVRGHGAESGLRKPDLLHGLEDAERGGPRFDELVHFLVEQGGPRFRSTPPAWRSPPRGSPRALRSGIPSAAPHATAPTPQAGLGLGDPRPPGWTFDSLSDFLGDPLAVHPPAAGCRSLSLTGDESSSIAAFLLAGGDMTKTTASKPGLQLNYFEGDFDGMGPRSTRSAVTSIRSGFRSRAWRPYAGRDRFGLHLSGEIEIPTSGPLELLPDLRRRLRPEDRRPARWWRIRESTARS